MLHDSVCDRWGEMSKQEFFTLAKLEYFLFVAGAN